MQLPPPYQAPPQTLTPPLIPPPTDHLQKAASHALPPLHTYHLPPPLLQANRKLEQQVSGLVQNRTEQKKRIEGLQARLRQLEGAAVAGSGSAVRRLPVLGCPRTRRAARMPPQQLACIDGQPGY